MTTVSQKPVLNAISQQAKTLANTEVKHSIGSFLPLDSESQSVIGSFFKAGLDKDDATTKLQDMLRSKGYKSFHFDRSNKDADAKKFHDSIIEIFKSKMVKSAQDLLKKEKASLNDMEQTMQQFLKNKLSTSFGNLYKAMQRIEDNKNVSGKADKITDDNVLALRDLQSAINRLVDAKKPCKNVVNIIAELRKVELLVKADGITVPKK